jgi:hypothetical protein
MGWGGLTLIWDEDDLSKGLNIDGMSTSMSSLLLLLHIFSCSSLKILMMVSPHNKQGCYSNTVDNWYLLWNWLST